MRLPDVIKKEIPKEIHRRFIAEAIISGERVRAVFKAGKRHFDRQHCASGRDCRDGFGSDSMIKFNFINAGRCGIRGIPAGVIPGRVFDFNINIFATETERNGRV